VVQWRVTKSESTSAEKEPAKTLDAWERRIVRSLCKSLNGIPEGGNFIIRSDEARPLEKLALLTKWRIRIEPYEGVTRFKKVVVESRGAALKFDKIFPRKVRPPGPPPKMNLVGPAIIFHSDSDHLMDELRVLPFGFYLIVPQESYKSSKSITRMARDLKIRVEVENLQGSQWRVSLLTPRRSETIFAKLETLREGESLVTWKRWQNRVYDFARREELNLSIAEESKTRIRVTKRCRENLTTCESSSEAPAIKA
jgi:hypothetical protein